MICNACGEPLGHKISGKTVCVNCIDPGVKEGYMKLIADAEKRAEEAERDLKRADETIGMAWSILTGWDVIRLKNGSHTASKYPSKALLGACNVARRRIEDAAKAR